MKPGRYTTLRRLSAFLVMMRSRKGDHWRDPPRTDPDGRTLGHPVLIADDWRRSELRGKDGADAVAEASDPLTRACGSTRTDAAGSGDASCATTVPATAVGTPRDCRGFLVPHSS